MRDNPAQFRRSLPEIEQWLLHGDGRKDESDLGRGLSDLESLDEKGRVRIDEGNFIIAFGRHRGKDIITINKEDPRYVDWLLSPKGIEDETARSKLKEFILSVGNG